MHIYTHTYTHAYTYIHAYIFACTHIDTFRNMCIYINAAKI